MNVEVTKIYVNALASLLCLIELLEKGAVREFRAGQREANYLETILNWSDPTPSGVPLPGAQYLCRTCGVPLQRQPEDERTSRAHAKACIRAIRESGQVYLNRHDADSFGKLISCLL